MKRVFSTGWTDPSFPLLILFLVGGVWAYQFVYESRWRSILAWRPLRIACVVAMVLYLTVCGGSGTKAFIYFQF